MLILIYHQTNYYPPYILPLRKTHKGRKKKAGKINKVVIIPVGRRLTLRDYQYIWMKIYIRQSIAKK